MARYFAGLAVLTLIVGTVGCSICCGPDDYNYGAYGGLHPRGDMQNGRVGSIFSDPSGSASRLTPHTELAQRIEPETMTPRTAPSNPGNDNLPKPGSNPNPNGEQGSGSKGIDTRRYLPRTYRQIRTTPNTRQSPRPGPVSKNGNPPRRRNRLTAALLGGQRYR